MEQQAVVEALWQKSSGFLRNFLCHCQWKRFICLLCIKVGSPWVSEFDGQAAPAISIARRLQDPLAGRWLRLTLNQSE